MSSKQDCVAEIFSSRTFPEINEQDLNGSDSLQQNQITGNGNINPEIQNNINSIFPVNNAMFVHNNSSIDCMKGNVVSEKVSDLGIFPLIHQNEKDNIQTTYQECKDTLEELKVPCDQSQNNLSSINEITLKSALDVKENCNHIDTHNQFETISIPNNKWINSNFDSVTQNSNKIMSKVNTDGEQITYNYNAADNHHEEALQIVESPNFKASVNFDLLNHYEESSTNCFSTIPDSLITLKNGEESDTLGEKYPKDIGNYEKNNCFLNNFEPLSCIYSNIKQSDQNLVMDINNGDSIPLNGACESGPIRNPLPQNLEDDVVMQTVVEGTLQPLSISTCSESIAPTPLEDEDSSSLFAGVSQEMILLERESSHVLDIIGNSSVKAVNLASDITTGNLETESSLTDISAPVNITSSLCPMQSAAVNPTSSGVSTEFGHILELDGKPSYLKILPLKNGQSLWNMHDLRLAMSQYGTVHLRLCATPDSADRSLSTSECNFSALFLDDEIPPTNSVNEFQGANVCDADKIKSTESRSCQTTFRDQISPISMDQTAVKGSMSDYSFALQTSEDIGTSTIRRTCLPPPQSISNYPGQTLRGKKRGRPPLHNKGEMVGSLSRVLEGGGIPFKVLKKNSSMDSIWKKYEKLQKSDPIVREDRTNINAEDRELSLGYKKLLSLTCVQCGAIFRNKTALSTHVKSKHRVFKKCRTCQERVHLQDKYSLRRHLLKAHKDRDQLMCFKCNVSFKVILHLKRHDNIIHETSESSDMSSCEFGSESEDDVCHLNKTDSLINASRKDKEQVDTKEPAVNIAPQPKELSAAKNEVQSDDVAESDYSTDDDAAEVVTTRSQLRSAAVIKKDNGSNEDSEESSDSQESGNESDVEDTNASDAEETKKFFCQICHVGFSHKFKLKHHMTDHAIEKSVKRDCNDEKDELSSKEESILVDLSNTEDSEQIEESLVGRRKTKRRTVTRFSRACTRSGKYFSESSSPHVAKRSYTKRSKWNKDKTGDLTDSDEESTSKVTKNDRPSYIIRRGRIFFCNKCNISFKREKMMIYHLKKIHETLYPFRACPDCAKIFRSCGPFNRHLSQHKFTFCPVDGCKAKYRNIRLVKKHQKKSHPDYTHRCYRCVRLFKKKSQLNQHLNDAHIQKTQEEGDKFDELSEENDEDLETMDEKIEVEKNNSKDPQAIVTGKRQRHEPVSYEEVDEEEFTSLRNVNSSRKRKASPSIDDKAALKTVNKKFKSNKLKEKLLSSSIKTKIYSKKLAKIDIKPEIKAKKKMASISKNKKLSTSWTAAIKAKYRDNKLTEKVTVANTISKCSKPKNSQSNSPAITADVIRRVSDSLLNRKKGEINKKVVRIVKPLGGKSKSRKNDSVKSNNDTKSPIDPVQNDGPSVASPSQINEDNPANVLGFDLF